MLSTFAGANRLPKSQKTSEVCTVFGYGFRQPTFWRTWLHQSDFKLTSPKIARIAEMIQNRTTIRVSGT